MTAGRPWSRDDLLTVTEAADRLGIRHEDGVAIVRRVALKIPGRDRTERVIWGDVLEMLRSPPEEPPPRARRGTLPRVSIPRQER